jgi:hypothetical protein
MSRIVFVLALAGFLALAAAATHSAAGSSSATITVDADPSTPGAQAGLNVPELNTFQAGWMKERKSTKGAAVAG